MVDQAFQGHGLERFARQYGVQLRLKNSFLEITELQKPGRTLSKQHSWSCPGKLWLLGDEGNDNSDQPTRLREGSDGRGERAPSEEGDSACCPSEHSCTGSSTRASTADSPKRGDSFSGKSDGSQVQLGECGDEAERCRSGSEDSSPTGGEAGQQQSQAFDIDSWDANVRTVMVKNLPQRLKRQDLITFLEDFGFADRCNFLYVPTRRNKLGVYPRFAFVGFDRSEDTIGFAKAIRGHRFRQSQKEVQCLPADIQGLEANMQHFSGTRVVGSRWCPLSPSARETRGSGEQSSTGHAWGRLKIPARQPEAVKPAEAIAASPSRATPEATAAESHT